jgi:hypothetical protein
VFSFLTTMHFRRLDHCRITSFNKLTLIKSPITRKTANFRLLLSLAGGKLEDRNVKTHFYKEKSAKLYFKKFNTPHGRISSHQEEILSTVSIVGFEMS